MPILEQKVNTAKEAIAALSEGLYVLPFGGSNEKDAGLQGSCHAIIRRPKDVEKAEILLVDLGNFLTGDELFKDILNVAEVAPDIRALLDTGYVKGILITHNHPDHTGALKPLVKAGINLPTIYGPEGVLEDIEEDLNKLPNSPTFKHISGKFNVGGFELNAIRVPHSIETVGYVARHRDAPQAGVFFSADFYFSHDEKIFDTKSLKEELNKGISYIVADAAGLSYHYDTSLVSHPENLDCFGEQYSTPDELKKLYSSYADRHPGKNVVLGINAVDPIHMEIALDWAEENGFDVEVIDADSTASSLDKFSKKSLKLAQQRADKKNGGKKVIITSGIMNRQTMPVYNGNIDLRDSVVILSSHPKSPGMKQFAQKALMSGALEVSYNVHVDEQEKGKAFDFRNSLCIHGGAKSFFEFMKFVTENSPHIPSMTLQHVTEIQEARALAVLKLLKKEKDLNIVLARNGSPLKVEDKGEVKQLVPNAKLAPGFIAFSKDGDILSSRSFKSTPQNDTSITAWQRFVLKKGRG